MLTAVSSGQAIFSPWRLPIVSMEFEHLAQRFMRASVEPCHPRLMTSTLGCWCSRYAKLTFGHFVLALRGRLQPVGDPDHLVVIARDAGDSILLLGRLGLFFDADDLSLGVDVRDAV